MPTGNYGQDVFATALQEHLPQLFDDWTEHNAIVEGVWRKKQKVGLKGLYREFGVVTGPPGRAVNITSPGMATGTGTRNPTGTKGSEYPARIMYEVDVPRGELDAITPGNPQPVEHLLKQYVDQGIAHLFKMFDEQIAMGGVSGVEGLFTLNAEATYNPRGNVRTGWLEFTPQGSQTAVVHGVSAVDFETWRNQYAHMNSMSGEGLHVIRQALGDANIQGAALGVCDVGLADRASYYNLLKEIPDHVRFTLKEGRSGRVVDSAPGQKTTRSGILFDEDCRIYRADAIRRDQFNSANAQLGLIYFLNTDCIEAFVSGRDPDANVGNSTKDDFRFERPYRVQGTDSIRYEILWDGNFHTTSRRKHVAVTGGAQD